MDKVHIWLQPKFVQWGKQLKQDLYPFLFCVFGAFANRNDPRFYYFNNLCDCRLWLHSTLINTWTKQETSSLAGLPTMGPPVKPPGLGQHWVNYLILKSYVVFHSHLQYAVSRVIAIQCLSPPQPNPAHVKSWVRVMVRASVYNHTKYHNLIEWI